jgi:hypothetical protein
VPGHLQVGLCPVEHEIKKLAVSAGTRWQAGQRPNQVVLAAEGDEDILNGVIHGQRL